MKRLLRILICAFVFGLLLFLAFQYYVKSQAQKGALQVTSTPESKVYLNDEYLGQTPLCKCEAADIQKAGDYMIRLVPQDKSLSEFQEKITITDGVLTVVDRKFGKDSLSEGSIISLTPLNDKTNIELLVASIPSSSKIFLDDSQIGETPLLFKNPTESDHVLKVTKDGYREKTVRIHTPVGYKLTVAMFLSIDGSSNQASASSIPTPTPLTNKVVILETPTGFLRVRESPSIGSVEIGRVLASEVYNLMLERPDWFEIKLKDGQLGWISAQYAKKQ